MRLCIIAKSDILHLYRDNKLRQIARPVDEIILFNTIRLNVA